MWKNKNYDSDQTNLLHVYKFDYETLKTVNKITKINYYIKWLLIFFCSFKIL